MSEFTKLTCDHCGKELEVPKEQKNREILCCGSPMHAKRSS